MKKRFSLALFIVLLMTLIFYKYMEISKESEIQNLANKTLESVKIARSAILDTYMVVAQKGFFDIMKNEKALRILEKFKYATKDEQNLLRGELYRLLYKEYELLKKLNVRQFHFHTHDGKSLLRFHMPHKSGDSLMDLRTSVKVANSEFKTMVGFEGGRIYPGYRYVFPIIYKDNHLGSVEFSVAFDGIEKKLKNILPFYAHKIIYKKAVIYEKVFEKYRDFYIRSKFDKNYYIENYAISKVTQKIQDDSFVNRLIDLAKSSPNFMKKLDKKESFAVPIINNDLGYIVTFLNVENIDKKHAGYIVSFGKLQEIVEIEKRYNIFILIGFIVAIFIYILVLIVIIQVQKIKEESLKLQKLIDIQNSIVVLTNGVEFKFANKKFFDFFGYKNLDDFLKEHNCICEKFIHNNNFFSLENVKKDESNWVESLLNLSERKRIVSMTDKNSITHTFTVSINKYDGENYIINFSDISDTIREKLQLQGQVVQDQLTKAYNRVYFDNNIDSFIESNINQHQKTGIIFFDIDHFKSVNDTYGHQVGDDILKTIAKLVKSNIRDTDKLIRWGGEEFMIILPANKIDDVYQEAEHIRATIEKYRFNEIKELTCSFGVALHEDGDHIDETIKKADDKLYEAKNSGRNRVVL